MSQGRGARQGEKAGDVVLQMCGSVSPKHVMLNPKFSHFVSLFCVDLCLVVNCICFVELNMDNLFVGTLMSLKKDTKY